MLNKVLNQFWDSLSGVSVNVVVTGTIAITGAVAFLDYRTGSFDPIDFFSNLIFIGLAIITFWVIVDMGLYALVGVGRLFTNIELPTLYAHFCCQRSQSSDPNILIVEIFNKEFLRDATDVSVAIEHLSRTENSERENKDIWRYLTETDMLFLWDDCEAKTTIKRSQGKHIIIARFVNGRLLLNLNKSPTRMIFENGNYKTRIRYSAKVPGKHALGYSEISFNFSDTEGIKLDDINDEFYDPTWKKESVEIFFRRLFLTGF